MGRIYAVNTSMSVTTLVDLLEINAPSDASIVVHGFFLTQWSEAGDAQSEQLFMRVHRASTSGSGGAATVTANPMQVGDPAIGATFEGGNTTQATVAAVILALTFNVMAGIAYFWTPESRPVISPSGRLIVELAKAPADSIGIVLTVLVEEVGG